MQVVINASQVAFEKHTVGIFNDYLNFAVRICFVRLDHPAQSTCPISLPLAHYSEPVLVITEADDVESMAFCLTQPTHAQGKDTNYNVLSFISPTSVEVGNLNKDDWKLWRDVTSMGHANMRFTQMEKQVKSIEEYGSKGIRNDSQLVSEGLWQHQTFI